MNEIIEFNPYILLVIQWLQNNDLVSKEELEDNSKAAYAFAETTFINTDLSC